MASVTSLSDSVQRHLASALSATRPEAAGADPLLRRSDRADYQANGILALAKKAKANPRDLAAEVVSHIVTGDELIKDVEVSGPGFLNITLADRAITANLAAGGGGGGGGRRGGHAKTRVAGGGEPPPTRGAGRTGR
ncbi:hypothetical protein ACFVIN_16230, partial [Streptomyces prasinus]